MTETEKKQKIKKDGAGNVFHIALVLLIICAAVAGIVSFVYSVTLDAYNNNLEGEIRSAISSVFAKSETDVVEYSEAEAAIDGEGIENIYSVRINGKDAGYCVNVTGSGFGGDISIMVGYNPDGSILGVRVVSHSETPGVGSKATEDSFLAQFDGKSGTLTVSKSGNDDIDAISGATISSKAITAAVNCADEAILGIIGGGEK